MSDRSDRMRKALTAMVNSGKIQIPLTVFEQYNEPHGFLIRKIECHALFFYYVNARRAYEDKVLTQPIMLEGEPDAVPNFPQLFESIAALYNVDPEAMRNYWELVDKQCDLLELPRMPEDNKYRFDCVIKLIH